MIDILISDKAYENDVYPLVKAFYPKEDIHIIIDENLFDQVTAMNPSSSDVNTAGLIPTKISVVFHPQQIKIALILETGNCIVDSIMTEEASLSKTQYKNSFKRLLYQMLSAATGKELPWGILTGIRPTKLVYEMLEKNISHEEITSHMKTEYLCSDDKISMSIKIAKRELELLREMDYQNGYSLYIGIPFCPSTCLYCSFTSYSITKFSDYVDQYLQALEKEILYCATCLPGKKLTTVYLGGGTPTTLNEEQLDWLLGTVKKHFDFTYVKEFCVEAGRPDSITREKLEILKKWGVDRISINPQSMQQKTLDLIGRKHSVEQIKEAFSLAREVGHENINMDIIIGLTGENPADVRDTLAQIKEMNPDSLTVHTLALKRAARLNMEKDNYIGMEASDVPEMLDATLEYTKENDYLPYYLYRQKNMADNLENIGYARYGKEGIYNILIMEEQQTIIALGAGAMSKFVFYEEHRLERVDNVKSITDYINRIDEMIQRKRDFIENHYQ